MNELFLRIVNMSIASSWLVLAVLILRFVLGKAPRWIRMLLWGIAGIRLVCPALLESPFSLIPSASTFPEKLLTGPSFHIQTGIPVMDGRINGYLGDHYFEGITVPAGRGGELMDILGAVWLLGMAALVVCAAVSWLRLRRRVNTAVRFRDNIFQSENISGPFVLGLIRPRIYLPFYLDEVTARYVTAHEQAHIRRKDHWWKVIGFAVVILHWFNPLIWAAYKLFCRDIELSCDESVVRNLGREQKGEYAEALLRCSLRDHDTGVCPLAFGEVGVKARIRSVMDYRKPAAWAIAGAVILCGVVAACFLTNPLDQLGWARELSAGDIARANLVVMPQNPDRQFKSLSESEIEKMTALINQSGGKYLICHPEVTGGAITFDIIMKDGSRHSVSNIGNAYLKIDNAYYSGDYEWLAAWEELGWGEGNSYLPADYY